MNRPLPTVLGTVGSHDGVAGLGYAVRFGMAWVRSFYLLACHSHCASGEWWWVNAERRLVQIEELGLKRALVDVVGREKEKPYHSACEELGNRQRWSLVRWVTETIDES